MIKSAEVVWRKLKQNRELSDNGKSSQKPKARGLSEEVPSSWHGKQQARIQVEGTASPGARAGNGLGASREKYEGWGGGAEDEWEGQVPDQIKPAPASEFVFCSKVYKK